MKFILKKSHVLDQLIEGCRRNDRLAQREVYEKFSPVMYPLCMRYLRDEMEAEDVMVNGFLKIFQKIKQFKGEGSFEGWMKRIMINESLGYLRKNKSMFLEVDIEYAEREPDYDKLGGNLEAQDIQRVILRLPAGYRTVFNLYAIEGYSHKEIALKLNISENTSKSQLSRGRRLLKKYLADVEEKENKNRHVK